MITIFATHNGSKERLVFCKARDLDMAKDIIAKAPKGFWTYETHEAEYTPKRFGLEGKDGKWV